MDPQKPKLRRGTRPTYYWGKSILWSKCCKNNDGSYLFQEHGTPSGSTLQSILNMIVASDNKDWSRVQLAIGKGNSEQSKQIMYDRTRELGFRRSRWFRGYMRNGLHGNELTVLENLYLLENLYSNNFDFGHQVLKVMLCGQKGYDMAKKYLPKICHS